jgi:hypothetical protein
VAADQWARQEVLFASSTGKLMSASRWEISQ